MTIENISHQQMKLLKKMERVIELKNRTQTRFDRLHVFGNKLMLEYKRLQRVYVALEKSLPR
jgi:hypothetical protein